MRKRKKIVRYITGVDWDKSSDEFKVPKWKSQKITSAYIKTYQEALPFLYELSGTERLVLDFALFRMDIDNFTTNDSSFKKDLNDFQDVCISSNTINKSFSKLCASGVFLKNDSFGRGLYQVNPLFFFKGTEQSRVKWIRRILEYPFYKENSAMREIHYSGI